jgi:hypothetical protein
VKNPESYLAEALGDLRKVVLNDGTEVDLHGVVRIPKSRELLDILNEHPEKVVVWKRLLAAAKAALAELKDELAVLEGAQFDGYWRHFEEQERVEMQNAVYDETDDPFRRRKATQRHVAHPAGAAGRWRRNFSDDLIHAHVKTDDKIEALKVKVRAAQDQVNVCSGVCDALEHRMRCLSHISAITRDQGG